ncbi:MULTISPECIES: electron transfer flavoprotein-ubiquinone oxidoreductase [unclassified Sphingopyxis]|uniref:electron transfer flavoprotein-ubiquinone oxidoreductase n=1 Tax=unclassified Sphingopyxis TaxID=2614943 RepID=UPI000730D4F3|nr:MULTISPECIES: electron transfer flavoprotein-ubiquinone oxidoreductase [unclassified Sphingopyxis]KTE25571.1 electron transfer flavoprotein-ubiquinone oxidoreductase [Sphingopyxis sp. H057]KTE53799.1 electron transfer flavoprotein-ubiquinone oxidoreductase [Sphingopyxis sp. H073]KTE56394.1 electron transfer flavoprotein-ubiquinone oxidoreductase [Sphingopyxis sp. H071]KTE63120.1 electron transfer flavoprotein-ubiquinone oxidoreductase [Sphingopyxis sp. H107]KTE67352.1 electron transfer flav
MSERESMPYDVVIVGAGPAGLSAAIRLKQLANEAGSELSVCVLEKGSEVGAHILSGAVIDPKSLDELLPDWRTQGCPLAEVPVNDNQHWVLTKNKKFGVPHFITPGFMHNKGTYTGSLGNLCRWLAEQAEGLGVEIFPGFAAAEILYNEDGSVKGVATGDMGIARDGSHKPDYAPGLELHAKYTFFAEGVRGHLTKMLKPQFALDAECEPQVYGIGIKELWDIRPENHAQGRVIHTQGWPLDAHANGGGFLYHQANGQVALGFVTWLNYRNPHISPFQEMQKWKTHPEIAKILKGGKRVSYGARAISDGGWQSVPKLAFPGGALIGDTAGFLNVPRIKGTHTAMKSGMMAAEAAFAAVSAGRGSDTLDAYQAAYDESWVKKELSVVRNVLPLVEKFGDLAGTILSGMTMWLETLGIRVPFTMKHHPDNTTLYRADMMPKPDYPKPDGVLTFDRLSSVFLSNTNHEEDQPVHLQLKDPSIPVEYNLPMYDEPAQRYCPAGVYEIVGQDEGDPKFVINAQNCVHCKTCDIKDPTQNINWVTPEGGGGPNYPNM